MLREKLLNERWKLPSTAQCALEAAQHCIVQTAAKHVARHSTHSTDRRLYESVQMSLKDRCPLACMGLHKAAWGQVVLRYICVLVFCCKRLDACSYTAYQGICLNVETLLESFFSIRFVIYLSLYFSSYSALRLQKGNLLGGVEVPCSSILTLTIVGWEDTVQVGSLLPDGLGPISYGYTPNIRIYSRNSRISIRVVITYSMHFFLAGVACTKKHQMRLFLKVVQNLQAELCYIS